MRTVSLQNEEKIRPGLAQLIKEKHLLLSDNHFHFQEVSKNNNVLSFERTFNDG